MRGRLLAVLALAALVGLTVAPTASADSRIANRGFGCVLITHLSPAEEVPPTASQARGIAILRVHESGEIRFTVVIVNPERETFVAGHIHEAPVGVNGPVVVPLFNGMDNRFVFHQSDEVMASPALAQAICDNPAGFYVNYHTTRFPGGAVRGQLD
jgi:hypothetical protein